MPVSENLWRRGPCSPCDVSKGHKGESPDDSPLSGTCEGRVGPGVGAALLPQSSQELLGLPLPEPPIATSLGMALPSLTARQARQNPTTLQVGPAAARGRDERHIY